MFMLVYVVILTGIPMAIIGLPVMMKLRNKGVLPAPLAALLPPIKMAADEQNRGLWG